MVRRWYVQWRFADPQARTRFEGTAEQAFALEHLRPDASADLGVEQNPNFGRDLPTSVLPLIVDLARERQLPVCFVRVQRRPVAGRPPAESPALRGYVSDLRRWVESRGAMFHDDTGDADITLDLYGDGDHVADRRRYTDTFRRRMEPLFR
jgi:hypothetical protein